MFLKTLTFQTQPWVYINVQNSLWKQYENFLQLYTEFWNMNQLVKLVVVLEIFISLVVDADPAVSLSNSILYLLFLVQKYE